MPSRGQAVHVATTRRKYKGRVYETHLLRRSYRDSGKVKHETLGNLSHLPLRIIEMIRGALRGDVYLRADTAFEVARSVPHGHVAAVVGALRRLGLDSMIAAKDSRERRLAVALVAARIFDPRSKLATARGLDEETKLSTLSEVLDIESASADELYKSMDWLLARKGRIEKKLSKKHLQDGSLVLYDVTSTYYTGTHCPLARFGYSRDRRRDYPQIVIGLLCNDEGCPIAVEVFEGNTADPKTVRKQVEKLRHDFGISRLVLVGDRGMLTSARIREELRPIDGLDWITALRAPAIRKLVAEGSMQMSLFDESDLAEIISPEFPGERLIACHNPLLADERRRKRKELLDATEKELEKVAVAVARKARPLRGKDKIALRVGKAIGRRKMAKHFKLDFSDDGFSYERNEESITSEAALDGIYVIRTSVRKKALCAEDAVRAYKGLSAVERAFRSIKTVDLKVRPIHHRLEDRVKAHVFLCMLAYYVEWHMRRDLAPILFDDDDKAAGEATRISVVTPAKRSPKALRKASVKRTADDYPVHSFRTLLQDLATLTKNDVRLDATEESRFSILTTPTRLQRKAFELLGVPLNA